MKRFVWKVIGLVLLVSVLPLLASGLIIQSLFRRAVAEGFREDIDGGLEQAAAIHRENFALRRQLMQAESQRLALDPALRRALEARDPDAAQRWLDALALDLADDEQAISRVEIAPLPDLTSPEAASPLPLAALDRRADFPADAWRAREVAVPIPSEAGPHEVRVTFVVPWSRFDRFEDLGKLQRYHAKLDEDRASLSAAYTKTFFLLAGGVLLVSLTLALLWARATTRPLTLLAEGAGRVGRGDLDVAIPVRGQDEVARLTLAFNAMVVELRAARTRLAYLERVSAWQEIARRLAHEIKNPLTPILLAVQQLDRKFDDYTDQPARYRRLLTDALEIVTEEVEVLRALVSEFSDFARLPRVEPRPARVDAFAADLLRTNPHLEPLTALLPSPDPPEALTAALDPALMRRVLVNLLDNARDALPTPHPDSPITLRVSRQGQAVCIAVQDCGCGVPPADLERIFEPYHTTKDHGTGLGLAIVRKIVIEHGGDIRALSPPPDAPQGTRMEILLPAIDPRDAP